jgi:hypothetical protein
MFGVYGCSIVALELSVGNQILCVAHQNDVFLNLHDSRLLFSEKCQYSMPDVGRTSFISK